MKQLICLISILFAAHAISSDKIMDCEALGSIHGEVLYEVQTEVSDLRVISQGTNVVDAAGEVVKKISLLITSRDQFKDHFSIQLKVKIGEEVIEKAILPDLSLSKGTKHYGLSKNMGEYRMRLSCNLI